jgi:hypothetical protein
VNLVTKLLDGIRTFKMITKFYMNQVTKIETKNHQTLILKRAYSKYSKPT